MCVSNETEHLRLGQSVGGNECMPVDCVLTDKWILASRHQKHMDIHCAIISHFPWKTYIYSAVQKNIHNINKIKRPMSHIAHLRNQLKSMNTFERSYDYIYYNWPSSSGGEDF